MDCFIVLWFLGRSPKEVGGGRSFGIVGIFLTQELMEEVVQDYIGNRDYIYCVSYRPPKLYTLESVKEFMELFGRSGWATWRVSFAEKLEYFCRKYGYTPQGLQQSVDFTIHSYNPDLSKVEQEKPWRV